MSSGSKRPRHPNKDVEDVIQDAEAVGWRFKHHEKGHSFGTLLCPKNDKSCRCGKFCQLRVLSTPRGNQVATLRDKIRKCIYLNKR